MKANIPKKPKRSKDPERMEIAVHIVACYNAIHAQGKGGKRLKADATVNMGAVLYSLVSMADARIAARKWELLRDRAAKEQEPLEGLVAWAEETAHQELAGKKQGQNTQQ